jgi:hypothetical protein
VNAYGFLANLCHAAGDEDGQVKVKEKQEESLDWFRLVDSVAENIKGVLAAMDPAT